MVAQLCLLLATACVATLFGQGNAQCVTASWGGATPKSSLVSLGTTVIEPNQHDVIVPVPRKLFGCKFVGVIVDNCQSTVFDSTIVELSFKDRLTVHLKRPYTMITALTFNAYCEPLVPPRSDE